MLSLLRVSLDRHPAPRLIACYVHCEGTVKESLVGKIGSGSFVTHHRRKNILEAWCRVGRWCKEQNIALNILKEVFACFINHYVF